MPPAVDVKVFPMCCSCNLIYFTVLLDRTDTPYYHSLESLYEFSSLACSVMSVSSGYISPISVALDCPQLNKIKTYYIMSLSKKREAGS
jgi:hypothetical protein